jgi:hypothetical protein
MYKATITDIVFCWVLSIVGITAFIYGLDTVINSPWHGAGLLISFGGLIMVAVSATESGKL